MLIYEYGADTEQLPSIVYRLPTQKEATMYGTVSRMRLKPGMEERMRQIMMGYESMSVPGMIG